jgi:hypothetical protein
MGLIPDGVIAICHSQSLSGRTVGLKLTQSLTEIIPRIFPGVVKADGA